MISVYSPTIIVTCIPTTSIWCMQLAMYVERAYDFIKLTKDGIMSQSSTAIAAFCLCLV